MKTLEQLFSDHDGKVVDKWASYIQEYERLFAPFRNQPVALLEVGVQNGGSLEIWDKYFPGATAIIGCDIDPACEALQFKSDRIHVVIGDASTEQCAHQVAAIVPDLDIVIDDGSHVAKDIIGTFSRYFSALKNDGLYVIEDLHCSYWSDYEGGLAHPYSAASFLKTLTDVLNHDHWGVARQRRDFLMKYSQRYGVQFDEDVLASIHSTTFSNSFCVIRKAVAKSNGWENALGSRRVIGHEAQVADAPLHLAGQNLVSPDQGSEPWTKYAFSTEEQLIGRISDLESVKHELGERIATLGKSLSDPNSQIGTLRQALAAGEDELATLKQRLAEREVRIAALDQSLSEHTSDIGTLRQALAAGEDELATLKQRLAESTGEIGRLRQAVGAQDGQIKELADRNALLNRLLASHSWRITRPLRFGGRLLRGEWPFVLAGLRPALLRVRRINSQFRATQILLRAIPHAIAYYGSPAKALVHAVGALRRDGLAGIKLRAGMLVGGGSDRLASEAGHDGQFDLYGRFIDVGFAPKVSIIIPNFNHTKFLRKRLDSIYNQTYKNIEVLLLDDCSTDGSLAVLKEYAERYPEITTCCFNETNSGGVFKQWKKGLELATGELAWIAESDDYCTSNLLEELVKPFSNQAVMLAFSRSDFVKGDPAVRVWTIEDYLNDLSLNCWARPFIKSAHWLVNNAWAIKNIIPNVSSAVFRHPGDLDLLGNQEWTNLTMCGDWIFYLAIVRGGLVAYNPNATNFYRQHPRNISVNTQKEDTYYREHEVVGRHLVSLYRLNPGVLERQREQLYRHWLTLRRESSEEMFAALYDLDRIVRSAKERKGNVIMAAYALVAGGGEIFPITLANMLKARGYAVTFFNCNREVMDPGVRMKLGRDVPLLQLDTFSAVAPVFNDLGIEIVHSHHAWVDVLLSTLLADSPGVSQVVTMHGMYEMMSPDHLKSLLPILEMRIDSFVYIAEKNLNAFPATFRCRKDFVRIANAIAKSQISPVPRHELGVASDDFVLCLVARAIPEKGWEEAINAVTFANANSKRKIQLLLIGDGPEFDRLRPTLKLDYVHFLGFRTNVMDYFATSDVGFLPSRFPGESCPLVLIECLRAGKPMLASNIGEIGQMLRTEDGLAGELFDLEDWAIPVQGVGELIMKLAEDGDRYQSMLARVPDAAAKFDPVAMVKGYEAVYRRCGTKRLLKC